MGFIPQDDHELRFWLATFASLIERDPEAVGLSPQEASVMASLSEAFDRAIDIAGNPIRRNGSNMAHKEEVRAQAVAIARVLAAKIRAHPFVSMETKFDLGIVRASDSRPCAGFFQRSRR